MKTIRNVFAVLILSANFANAQTIDKTLLKLIDHKFIDQKQSKDFEELLKKGGTKSNALYLYGLFQFEYKKLTGDNYSQFGSHMSFAEEKLKPNEQVKVNEELTQYLSGLKICDLVKDDQYAYFKTEIDKNKYIHLLQLLSVIMEQAALKEYMNPEKLKVFADKLKSKEIVSTQYEKLITDIEEEKLQNPIDFLNYCNKTVIIKEEDYPDEPEKYLELIHQKTASIIPELSFTDFEFQVVLDSSISDSDSKFYDFVVSLKSNNKDYKQKSSYHLYSASKNQYYGNKIDQQEYYKLFNKILTDLQSPYRLHEVKAYEGNAVELNNVFGIIALTKEQADLLHSRRFYFMPSYESFRNKPTSNKVEQAIEGYKKIGLLSHLTTEQIKTAREKVSGQENNNLNDVLLAFPDVIHMFDTELGNLEDPYTELIREYRKISHDDFNATEISDNFDIEKSRKAVLKFKIGNKAYSKTLKIESDWIDTDFFDFVKNVVIENKLKGQFYELYTGGQEASIIYLTKGQYDYLKTNKLLVFAEDEWKDEE